MQTTVEEVVTPEREVKLKLTIQDGNGFLGAFYLTKQQASNMADAILDHLYDQEESDK